MAPRRNSPIEETRGQSGKEDVVNRGAAITAIDRSSEGRREFGFVERSKDTEEVQIAAYVEEGDRVGAGVGQSIGESTPAELGLARVWVERNLATNKLKLSLDGTLTTRQIGRGQAASAAWKVIVYPDQAAYAADLERSGVASIYLAEARLKGGALVLEGFSESEFMVSQASGVWTARPSTGLQRVLRVPDAGAAVVTLVADPRIEEEITAVPMTNPIGIGALLLALLRRELVLDAGRRLKPLRRRCFVARPRIHPSRSSCRRDRGAPVSIAPPSLCTELGPQRAISHAQWRP